jgi:MFS family permease
MSLRLALPTGAATTFRALRHRNFRLFWTGQLVSVTGTWMQSVAQGWLMYRLTRSPLLLGLLGFTQFLPVLLFTLWAGVVADRVDKRRMIVITQSLAMVQAAALAVLTATGWVQPWMVLVLAFVFGTINAFDLPARQSFLVEMVGKEDLTNAIALNSAAFNSARIVGPALAGVTVVVLGEAGCFGLNAVSYVAVIWSLQRMQLHATTRETRVGDPWGHLREGVAYAWGNHPIRNLLLLLGAMAGLGFQFMVLLPVYARDILEAGAGTYGMLVSAFGLGSLISALRLAQRHDRWRLRRNLLVGLCAAAAGMAGFAHSRVLWLSLPAAFTAGFGLIFYVASTNTLVQLTTEDRFRGRVMSLYTLMFIGTAPLGAITLGAIAQRWGAPAATSFSALVLLLGAVWVAYRLRVLAAREAAQVSEPAPEVVH